MNKKGFFFTFVMFLMVSYILLSISLLVKNIDISEKQFSNRFRSSNLELATSQLTSEKVGKVADVAVYYSLFKLNEHSGTSTVKTGEDTSTESGQLKYAKLAMENLVKTGTADAAYFDDGQPFSIGREASMEGWKDELDKSLRNMGFEVSQFDITSFEIRQISYDKVKYSFTLNLKISERSGLTSITKMYNIDRELPLAGMVDPALKRQVESKTASRPEPITDFGKEYYFNETYPDFSSVALMSNDKLAEGTEGQGWFYGYLVETTDAASVDRHLRSRYILVGDYDSIVGFEDFEDFGAYIVTSLPLTSPVFGCITDQKENEDKTFNALRYAGCDASISSSSHTTEKPFVVTDDFIKSKWSECDEEKYCALIIAQKSPPEVRTNPESKLGPAVIYDIERLRDFALCGYYTKNAKSPSYLQRMLSDPYSFTSTNGMESFVVGNFIGGEIDANKNVRIPQFTDDKSRLDREFVAGTSGEIIRGMPGCANAEMCKEESLLGHFRLGQDGMADYGTGTISCNDGRARCN